MMWLGARLVEGDSVVKDNTNSAWGRRGILGSSLFEVKRERDSDSIAVTIVAKEGD